jgi:hypothetical protein
LSCEWETNTSWLTTGEGGSYWKTRRRHSEQAAIKWCSTDDHTAFLTQTLALKTGGKPIPIDWLAPSSSRRDCQTRTRLLCRYPQEWSFISLNIRNKHRIGIWTHQTVFSDLAIIWWLSQRQLNRAFPLTIWFGPYDFDLIFVINWREPLSFLWHPHICSSRMMEQYSKYFREPLSANFHSSLITRVISCIFHKSTFSSLWFQRQHGIGWSDSWRFFNLLSEILMPNSLNLQSQLIKTKIQNYFELFCRGHQVIRLIPILAHTASSSFLMSFLIVLFRFLST